MRLAYSPRRRRQCCCGESAMLPVCGEAQQELAIGSWRSSGRAQGEIRASSGEISPRSSTWRTSPAAAHPRSRAEARRRCSTESTAAAAEAASAAARRAGTPSTARRRRRSSRGTAAAAAARAGCTASPRAARTCSRCRRASTSAASRWRSSGRRRCAGTATGARRRGASGARLACRGRRVCVHVRMCAGGQGEPRGAGRGGYAADHEMHWSWKRHGGCAGGGAAEPRLKLVSKRHLAFRLKTVE
jgi:hypothetical protein